LGAHRVWIGESAARQVGAVARPLLDRLTCELRESANLAMLDRDMAVIVAHSPSAHPLRISTEVGQRVFCHRTGVGKVILSQLPDPAVRDSIDRVGMPPATDRTTTDVADLLVELAQIRRQSYGADDGEHEVGVRCFAVRVPGAPTPTALSVSGPAVRMTHDFGVAAVPVLHRTAMEISNALFPPTQRSQGRHCNAEHHAGPRLKHAL